MHLKEAIFPPQFFLLISNAFVFMNKSWVLHI